MPGPGGGSHGGGGGRAGGGGGFSGGSHGGGGGFHGGGGFGGGHHGGGHHGGGMHGGGMHPGGHRPPHHGGFHGPHFGGGWFRRRRGYYGGGGGCLGGFAGIIVSVIVVVFVLGMFLINTLGFAFTGISQSDTEQVEVMEYDENTFQDYANTQYKKEFGSSAAYEDNILLVFLADTEECYDYYYIAWVGDHIETDINYLFGDEYTEFGQAVSECINSTSYKYSLDSNIADVVKQMENYAVEQGLESSFTCEEEHAQVESHLTNKTSLDMTEDTVNTALQSFTEKTGIPIVVVVDDIDDVFPSQTISQSTQVSSSGVSYSSVLVIVLVIILVAVAVFAIVKIVRKKKQADYDSED